MLTPNQLRWKPFDIPERPHDFIDGLASVASAGHPSQRNGLNILIYTFTNNSQNRAMYNSDGDFLIGTKLFIIVSDMIT